MAKNTIQAFIPFDPCYAFGVSSLLNWCFFSLLLNILCKLLIGWTGCDKHNRTLRLDRRTSYFCYDDFFYISTRNPKLLTYKINDFVNFRKRFLCFLQFAREKYNVACQTKHYTEAGVDANKVDMCVNLTLCVYIYKSLNIELNWIFSSSSFTYER